jgi:hypothetical protein
MALTTAGLLLGAVVLAVGLVLVLLPLNYSGNAQLPGVPCSVGQCYYHPCGDGNYGLVTVQVTAADLSFGGATLTINFDAGGTDVDAFLYSGGDGAAVQDCTPGSAQSIDSLNNVTSGTLTDAQATPGDSYAAIFVAPTGFTPWINLTWSGSVNFPYAYVGVPLVVAGAVIMIAVVLSLPQKQEPFDQAGEGVPMREAYIYETPTIVVDSPPSSSTTAPSPGLSTYSSPPPPPRFAPRPAALGSGAPAPRSSRWRAIPLHRSVDADSSPARAPQPLGLTSPPTSSSGATEAVPTPSLAASASGDGGPKCPRCRLPVGDPTWAFCPRCKTELS